ncbi:hypothetical protein MKW92_019462, partial [Papaver armeniacum]
MADRTSTIKNQKIINARKKPPFFWQIFQIRSVRLISKRHSFLNVLIEKIYMDTLLYIINILRINRALSNISNKNSHHFCSPVDLSQAYVFYKLSQTQVINKYHMRSVLQYNGMSFFLKDRIKNFFGTQGIHYSESRHKKLSNFE